MTDYIGYTSGSLQLLKDTITLYESKPSYTVGVANDIWTDIGEELKKLIQPIIDGITQALAPIWQNIQTWINNTITPIVTGVKNAVEGVINSVTSGIGDAINGFVTWLQNTINSIGDWFDTIVGQIQNTINNISNWFNQAFNNISDWITNAVDDVITGVGTWIGGVVDQVSQWFVDTYNNIKTWLENTVNNVGEWLRGVYNSVSDFINRVVEGIKSTYESVKQTVEDKIQLVVDWFNRTKQGLTDWFNRTVATIKSYIFDQVLPKVNGLVDGVKSFIKTLEQVWSLVSAGKYDEAFSLIDETFRGLGIPAPIATLKAIISVTTYFYLTVQLQFIPMQVSAQRQAEIALALNPIDLGSAASAVYRGVATEAQYFNNARLGGISPDRAKIALEGSRALPTPGQIQESFLRGEINLQTHDKLLSGYGFTPDNIELIKELYLLIPGASDLIRMAVREAFTPEIATKFGQYEDLPKPFIEWGKKIGLSEDWCGRYWAAHWELPSPSMGFEMLHRGIITDEELKLLLRALDVMPFWRERLIKLSYNPLTRVDVRRMYQLGVIDQDEVTRAYLDLGYNQEKANWLTEFTTRYYTPEDQTEIDEYKSMARGTYSQAFKKHIISEEEYRQFLLGLKYHPDDVELLIQIDSFQALQSDKLFDLQGYRKDWQKLIIQAYDRGLLHQNEIIPMLVELGYDESEAQLEVSLSDYNRSLRIRNMVAEQVHEQYISYIIDNVGAYTLLDQFNFTSEEIDKLMEEWNIERSLRTKRPPLTDLKKFLTGGLITLEEFLDELRGEGYHERYIGMYAQTLAKT